MARKTVAKKMEWFTCACNAGGLCDCYAKESARLQKIEDRAKTRNYSEEPTRKQLLNTISDLVHASIEYSLSGLSIDLIYLKNVIKRASKIKK